MRNIMLTYEEVCAELFSHRDETYRDFHKKLLKNERIEVIGVRMPVLRKLAKTWKGEWKSFLSFEDGYYEITFLKCAVVGMLPYEEFVGAADAVVPLLDNWATCDCFDAPCIGQHLGEFLPYVRTYLRDEREFVHRYGLVTLLRYYMSMEYLSLIFESVKEVKEGQYYVTMAAAWLLAEVLAKFYGEGVTFLRSGGLPKELHNKAIRKACESYRLSGEQKQELKALRMS